jgi:hypothetical protein
MDEMRNDSIQKSKARQGVPMQERLHVQSVQHNRNNGDDTIVDRA